MQSAIKARSLLRYFQMTMNMKRVVLVALLLQQSWATQELNSQTFEELMKSGRNGMVKFFQPWCGHCTRMKPDWDRLAEEAHASVFIADVNCSDQEELCSSQNVGGYPTIKVFKNGEVEDYSGGRGYDDLLEFVDSNLATKCDVNNVKETCSEKAVDYAAKWKDKAAADIEKEVTRLSGMVGKSMAPDLKTWLRERLVILQQFQASAKGEL